MNGPNGHTRVLRTSNLNRASFFWINSESQNVVGTNNRFSYDITLTPLDKNKSHNITIKSVTFANNSPQITAAYNYNRIFYEIVRESDNVVMTTRSINIAEGTYDSAQLVYAYANALNSDFLSVSGTYGGDPHTITYSDITNRLTFRRTTFTAVGGNTFYLRLLANDANSTYNGETGFGMGFVLGLPYGGTLTLPRASATADVACPNPPELMPYRYFNINMTGVNNYNHSSDAPSVNNIVFRCPLVVGTSRYSYIYIEEPHPDFGMLFFSTLPSRFEFSITDQYGQLFPLAENSAIDLCLKVVPLE